MGRHLTHEMKVDFIHHQIGTPSKQFSLFLMECIQIDKELASLNEIQCLYGDIRKWYAMSEKEVYADQRLVPYVIVKSITADEFKRHILYYISLSDLNGPIPVRHFFYASLKRFIQLTNQNLSVTGVVEEVYTYINKKGEKLHFFLSWFELLIHLLHNHFFTFSEDDYKIVGQQIMWLLGSINEDILFCICIQLLESILCMVCSIRFT